MASGGGGTVQIEGTLNIGGTSTTDKPILGTLLNLGNGTTATTMGYHANTVPLVVQDTGNITVNANATLSFNGCGSVTAISNGDTNLHTITIAGGTVSYSDSAERFVAMGVTVNSGQLNASGGILHFTTYSAGPGNGGLIVNGGQVNDAGMLVAEQGIFLAGGTTSVTWDISILVSGQDGASRTMYLDGGTLQLRGLLIAYGGIDMLSGVLTTNNSTKSKITMNSSDLFYMDGGELDVTPSDLATGKLEVAGGNMQIYGGTVVDNCDSSQGTFGQLKVDNNLSLSGSGATFYCKDRAGVGVPGFSFAAITVGGTFDNGDFNVYDLPLPTSSHRWNNNVLTITV